MLRVRMTISYLIKNWYWLDGQLTLYNPNSNVDTVPELASNMDHGLPCLSFNRSIKKAEADLVFGVGAW